MPPFTILLLLLLLVYPLNAQKKGYSIGYVINFKGDTLHGYVKDRSTGTFFDLYPKIRFKAKKQRIKRKLGPRDILGYGSNGNSFESVPLQQSSSFFKTRYDTSSNSDRVFLKVIEKQQGLTYYHWEYVHEDNNYLDYVPLFYLSDQQEMVRVTQGIFGLKRNALSKYFQDCPALVNNIKKKQLNSAAEVFKFYCDQCNMQP